MSRVDEAMRRAAEAALRRTTAGPSANGTGDPAAVSDLDAFPFEAEGDFADTNPEGREDHRLAGATNVNVQSVTRDDVPLFRRFDFNLSEKLVVDRRILPVAREQYRRIAAILHDAQASRGLRVAMIASAVASEGKSLTASNLALTLSESYRRRVLLIDADLRRPALHRTFRIDAASGLADGLDPTSQGRLIVRQVLPNLAVLPAGNPVPDPMARIISERMRQLIEEASKTFDWVIIDAPPMMLLPDAHLLASMVDAAVLVVKAGSTPHHLVKRTIDAIGKQRILGVVLNRGEVLPGDGYDDDQDYYYTKRRPQRS